MNWENLITVIAGALLSVAPQIITALPAAERNAATAILAAAVSIWHLYQPSPSSTPEPKK